MISVDKWLLSLLDQQEGWWTVVYERKHCFFKMANGCIIARGEARVCLTIGESSVVGTLRKIQVRGHFGEIK